MKNLVIIVLSILCLILIRKTFWNSSDKNEKKVVAIVKPEEAPQKAVVQKPPITCCFGEIAEGNRLLDFDDRYEMSKTGNNLQYWLHGVDIQKFPECMWELSHEKCTRDGCLLKRKDRGTIFRLSRLNKDTIRLQKISKGQSLGKEPIDFEYNEPKKVEVIEN